jgi:hypothetical protein
MSAYEPEPAQITVELAEAALRCPGWAEVIEPMPAEKASEDPKYVLTCWLRAVFRRLRFPSCTPWRTALCVLLQLGIDIEATTVAELADSIRAYAARVSGEGNGVRCLDCGEVHDISPVGDFGAPPGDPGRTSSPVGVLADFGAVAWADAGPHGLLWLTPLGRMLAISLFFGCQPTAEADAAAVVELLGPLPSPIQLLMIQLWFTGRSPADAVRELLAYAEPRAGEVEALAALLLASMAGSDGIQAWREWAVRPGFGVYARDWLRGAGEPLPPEVDDMQLLTDKLWRQIDMLASAVIRDPGPCATWFGQIVAHGPDAVEAITWAWRQTGHPAVPRLVETLTSLSQQAK